MNKAVQARRIAWQPIKGSSQALALDSRAKYTLLCGSRGGGKTETQLMRFRRLVGQGYGAYWRGIIFDFEYKNLEDLIVKSKKLFGGLGDGAKFLSSKSDYKWVWPTGEELLFRAAKKEADYWKLHGQVYPFLGWNELTKHPDSSLFYTMQSINRSSYRPEKDGFVGGKIPPGALTPMGPNGQIPKPIPLENFSTTNSLGPGRLWVKQDFIDPAPYGKMFHNETTLYSPTMQKEVVVKTTRVAIFSSFRENIYLDDGYIADMMQSCASDPDKYKSWILGDWNIVYGGGIFDGVFSAKHHIIPDFDIPENWRVDRAMDWGSTHPTAIVYFAESNGEEVKLRNGQVAWWPAGTLFCIREIYTTTKIGSNKGTKASVKTICEMIKELEAEMKESGFYTGKVYAGPADNQINNVNESDTATLKQQFEAQGIYWEKSDKSKGTISIGLQLVRDRFEHGKEASADEKQLYFFNSCRAIVATVPSIPRDIKKPDIHDPASEDHLYDAIRYKILKEDRILTNVKTDFGYGKDTAE